MTTSPRPAGRPRKAVLTADTIHRTALELIDRDGADAFSLVRLAKELGVRMPSLYNHVRNRDDVVHAVRELIAAEIDSAALALSPWDTGLADWARAYRAAFARHPNAVRLLATMPVRTPRVLDEYERVAVALESGGWPTGHTLRIIAVLESFVLGSALDMVAPEHMIDLASDAARYPRLTAAFAAAATATGTGTGPGRPAEPRRADVAFEFGLRVLVNGLRDELAILTADPTEPG
ncbi:TetR/AcrR family transcriptional regulator [Embleya sp. NPDC050493]|uniref:TetR/AcrR family transcriptional regulator n=1 Tax=Embleya sp. NPDC050493 TaxID=3363989 RepID=UPI0037A93413